MTTTRGIHWARTAGLLLGATIALAMLWTSRPSASSETLGAQVSFHANPTGELAVSPAGPAKFMDERALKPGKSSAGSFALTNQTSKQQAVRMRALSSDPALDELFLVELGAGGQLLAAGPLASLDDPTGRPLLLAPGATETVTVSVSLDSAAGAAAAAALADVGISFELGDAAPPRQKPRRKR